MTGVGRPRKNESNLYVNMDTEHEDNEEQQVTKLKVPFYNYVIIKENINMDADTWARARGWALWKALITLADIEDKSSPAAEKQKNIINRVIEDHIEVEKLLNKSTKTAS